MSLTYASYAVYMHLVDSRRCLLVRLLDCRGFFPSPSYTYLSMKWLSEIFIAFEDELQGNTTRNKIGI
jgi:hypothetical protein